MVADPLPNVVVHWIDWGTQLHTYVSRLTEVFYLVFWTFFIILKALLFFMMSNINDISKSRNGKKVEGPSRERVKVAFFIITFHVCSQFIVLYIVCVVCCSRWSTTSDNMSKRRGNKVKGDASRKNRMEVNFAIHASLKAIIRKINIFFT